MERRCDDWIESYLKWTSNSEPPTLFRLWTAVGVVAAALQRKCFVKWGALTFYPNMYIVLVGPSGCRKGTAMSPGFRLLRDIGMEMAAQATTRQALIRRLKNTNYTQTDPATGEVYMHSSLTIFSEEFTVFLGYQNNELMADLCDWFDCKETWTYETKNMGTDKVIGVWVNLIGATTPSLIQSSLPVDSIGGGLTSRMIFVYEERKEKTIIFPDFPQELEEDLRIDLEKINLMSGQFNVTEDFFGEWAQWYSTQSFNPPFSDDRFDGYIDRRPTHVMKLSMICAASRGSKLISAGDFRRALHFLEMTEVKMPQVFSGHGRSFISSLLNRVMTLLSVQGTMSLSDLMQRFYQDADRKTMDSVLSTMEAMGTLKIQHTKDGVILQFQRPKTLVQNLHKSSEGNS